MNPNTGIATYCMEGGEFTKEMNKWRMWANSGEIEDDADQKWEHTRLRSIDTGRMRERPSSKGMGPSLSKGHRIIIII